MKRMGRRRAALLVVAGLVVAGAGGVATGVLPAAGLGTTPSGSTDGSGGTTGAPASPVETALVERRTIEVDREFEGSLGYEGSLAVTAGSPGTVTWLPETGTLLERGDRLYELDGTVRPRLLYGSRPLWRTLEPGLSNGSDIQQLEENLVALGVADSEMEVDRHWDRWTTKAVKRWQRAADMTVDGSIDGSDAIFLPGAIRVTDLQAQVGSTAGPGAPVLRGTSPTRVVTIELAADEVDQLAAGTEVSVELPNGAEVAGHVRSIGSVATPAEDTGLPGGGGSATLPVTIDLDEPEEVAAYDQAPVTVRAVVETREDVLVVPVLAIVALLEGGYAVEVVEDDGSRRYVAVDLGLFDSGDVEISGDDIAEGDAVVVPS